MGFLQHKQVRRPPDGTEHGMRARHRKYPCQLTVSGTHLYCVRLKIQPFQEIILNLVLNRMTAAYLDKQPHLLEKWSKLNPMGRIGRPDELRGVIAWLASDASSFCTGSE